jgi:hypothetical protein
MEHKLIEYQHLGYLDSMIVDGEELLHLSTPCRFRVSEDIVSDLKKNYKPDPEIGGILWSKPTTEFNEIVHIVDKVTYIRNAIDDYPRADHRNKSNAYLPDRNELNQTLNDLFSQDYLPVIFHTHHVNGTDILQFVTFPNLMTETSEQVKRESYLPYKIGNKKLFMPRGLIVGHDISSSDIFIGVYDGFIAPREFDDSIRKIKQENFQKAADLVSSINPSDGQKIGLAIGAALLLIVIAQYPKHSLPVIIGLCATLPLLMTNTNNVDNPEYFNKFSDGKADIFIPKS